MGIWIVTVVGCFVLLLLTFAVIGLYVQLGKLMTDQAADRDLLKELSSRHYKMDEVINPRVDS